MTEGNSVEDVHEKKLYEIINPSDAYTFYALTDDDARIVGLLVGEGQYGIHNCKTEDEVLPILLWNTDKYLTEKWGSGDGFFKKLEERLEEVIEALESVMSFSDNQRFAYDEALKLIPEQDRQKYRDAIHDKNRGSLNDIGSFAWRRAEALRKKRKTDEKATG